MATKVLNGLDLTNQKIINLGSPSAAGDATNKSYVDAKINGLRWKESVVAATTGPGTLASDFEDGDTIDGVELATGDRILIKNQADESENGIYVVAASGAPTRAEDCDSTDEMQSATVFVHAGTANADTAWTQTEDDVDVDTDDNLWTEFGGQGGATYTFGDGLDEDGGTVTVDLTATSGLEFSSGDLQIADSIAGNGLGISSKVLAVNVGDGLEIATDAVAIDLAANSGLTFSGGDLTINSSIAGDGLDYASGVLSVDAGTGISTSGGDVAIDTGTVVRKYATTIGNNSNTSFTVTHGLGTRDVTVEVYKADSTTWETVLCDVARSNANTNDIVLTFAAAPATDEYRVVVHG